MSISDTSVMFFFLANFSPEIYVVNTVNVFIFKPCKFKQSNLSAFQYKCKCMVVVIQCKY